MQMMRAAITFVILSSLVSFCSCVARPESRARTSSALIQPPAIPAEIAMNKDAGRGNDLFVTLRLGNGQKLPFILDTGASVTAFDKSLEPQLGKRLGTNTVTIFGVRHPADDYLCPTLYLGDTPLLMTGPHVVAMDCRPMAAEVVHPVMGLLGMDVLGHYCIQLDFHADKIRFLDDQHADKVNWGKPFTLIDSGDGRYYISDNLAGVKGPGSVIDTGYNSDGWLVPRLFEQWSNQGPIRVNGEVYPNYETLDGDRYPQVNLLPLKKNLFLSGDLGLTLNGIGLEFLSRNLVTLDFPNRIMYLKRASITAPLDRHMKNEAWSEGQSAWRYLRKLMKKGQLPGWSKNDTFPTMDIHCVFRYPDSVTFDDFTKGWDLSHYHYEVVRTSQKGPWKLVKAWRTDPSGRTIEEYSVP